MNERKWTPEDEKSQWLIRILMVIVIAIMIRFIIEPITIEEFLTPRIMLLLTALVLIFLAIIVWIELSYYKWKKRVGV
jgi:magnesium-transporting ATPase (P-type)